MPQPGQFILHDHAIPPLEAGHYRVVANHKFGVDGAAADPIEGLTTHVEVTGPRFVLPAGELLSTFPPNRGDGAFESRLPQVVLKRRTLPWERKLAGAPRSDTPWLALVVIAEGEGELLADVPVTEAVPPEVLAVGRRDAERTMALRVPQSTLNSVFPAADELHLLAHVREVDVTDTELGLGDDDGWMAVVIANRLPRPGGKYHACLISLEGQLSILPSGHHTVDSFGPDYVFEWIGADIVGALVGGTHDPAATPPRSKTAAPSFDAWAPMAPAPPEHYANPVRTSLLASSVIKLPPLDARYTFPVLAHFSFSCSGAGDFASRMQALDVGLLGTPAKPPVVEPGKPVPPRTRPVPEITDTGHLGLDALSREGDPARVWYRGPLLVRPGTRAQPSSDGKLPLHHVSDELRTLGPDGRENLSLAVAFEIGRLLALADPGIVAAFLRWRRDRFHARRREQIFAVDTRLKQALQQALPVEKSLLLSLGAPSPVLPVLDPGLLPFAAMADPAPIIQRGMGVDLNAVSDPPLAPIDGTLETLPSGDFDALRQAQSRTLDRVAQLAAELGGTP
jgi:hypothetical protein